MGEVGQRPEGNLVPSGLEGVTDAKPGPRVVVLACITGGYDLLRRVPTECECVLVADSVPKAEKGALEQWRVVSPEAWLGGCRAASRLPKFLPHRFAEADVSIWTDAHLRWRADPLGLLEYLGDGDIAAFEHPIRSCLRDEAAEVVRIWPELKGGVRRQMAYYRKVGYPAGNRLMACGVLVRRHTPAMAALGEAWRAEWERWGTARDQLSFPYVCWRAGVRCGVIPGNVMRNGFEVAEKHLKARTV